MEVERLEKVTQKSRAFRAYLSKTQGESRQSRRVSHQSTHVSRRVRGLLLIGRMTGANMNLVTINVKLGENDPEPEQNLDPVCLDLLYSVIRGTEITRLTSIRESTSFDKSCQ